MQMIYLSYWTTSLAGIQTWAAKIEGHNPDTLPHHTTEPPGETRGRGSAKQDWTPFYQRQDGGNNDMKRGRIKRQTKTQTHTYVEMSD